MAWSFEYLHQCHTSRKEIIILKLDFAKAFDTIEHSVITQMMQCMGFDDRWMGWVKEILVSANTSVLLNGVPGVPFSCKRGVR